jgi:hypothetical protein
MSWFLNGACVRVRDFVVDERVWLCNAVIIKPWPQTMTEVPLGNVIQGYSREQRVAMQAKVPTLVQDKPKCFEADVIQSRQHAKGPWCSVEEVPNDP